MELLPYVLLALALARVDVGALPIAAPAGQFGQDRAPFEEFKEDSLSKRSLFGSFFKDDQKIVPVLEQIDHAPAPAEPSRRRTSCGPSSAGGSSGPSGAGAPGSSHHNCQNFGFPEDDP
ncbi:hypothetical protein IE53DRAFT_385711 [Violaceomyces palustris]|uniref:Uncharacterized protein n=1 Tax=Violaceomyces palustris TaxID=1673888 RepID=A0ACD0P1L0_9BASI|nr:hypothetical protein IE53DRAFT_385711 [Violaceomyces palustris]